MSNWHDSGTAAARWRVDAGDERGHLAQLLVVAADVGAESGKPFAVGGIPPDPLAEPVHADEDFCYRSSIVC